MLRIEHREAGIPGGWTRREWMRVGGIGLGGLSLPSLIQARAAASPSSSASVAAKGFSTRHEMPARRSGTASAASNANVERFRCRDAWGCMVAVLVVPPLAMTRGGVVPTLQLPT